MFNLLNSFVFHSCISLFAALRAIQSNNRIWIQKNRKNNLPFLLRGWPNHHHNHRYHYRAYKQYHQYNELASPQVGPKHFYNNTIHVYKII